MIRKVKLKTIDFFENVISTLRFQDVFVVNKYYSWQNASDQFHDLGKQKKNVRWFIIKNNKYDAVAVYKNGKYPYFKPGRN